VDTAQQARISVIIPTYNRSALLARTLETLCAQRVRAGEFEVIVADDGSADDTEQVARSFAGRLRLRYCFQEDQGFRVAAARNAGAKLAAAPVLAFLDCGTLAGPDFVGAHLDAQAAGGRVVLGYCFGYRPLLEMAWLTRALGELRPDQAAERYADDPAFQDQRHGAFARVGFDLRRLAAPWFLFWTMNLSVPADAFWQVGGFDEGYRSWGGEDIDLGYRLFQHGVDYAMSREAWTIEFPQERDVNRDLNGKLQSAMRNARYFLKKHSEPIAEIAFGVFKTDDLGLMESGAAALAAWTKAAAGLDVRAELAQAAPDIPAGASVAIVGCGPVIPAALPPSILLEFDGRLLAQALADPRHTGYQLIGLRTPLRTGAVDLVILT
jgi:glycosyltransferase involved in cell wall biosynthesis